jgi:hypothetical protein
MIGKENNECWIRNKKRRILKCLRNKALFYCWETSNNTRVNNAVYKLSIARCLLVIAHCPLNIVHLLCINERIFDH